MNFSNYTRIQLGIPRSSAEYSNSAMRRDRMMQMSGFGNAPCPLPCRPPTQSVLRRMNGFGAFGVAVSEVTGQKCYADSYQSNWEGYCDCLYTPGGANMKYCCGAGNVKADGSCGVSSYWAGTGFLNAPWTVLGKAERWAKQNDPNFNILNPTTWGPAKSFIESLIAKGNNGYVDDGSVNLPPPATEEKKDNTTMLVVGGVAAVAILAFAMRK